MDFVNEFYSKLDVFRIDVLFAIFMVIICPVTWTIIARIEYYTKYITKKCKNKYIAADIFANLLIEMGVLRNYMAVRVVKHSDSVNYFSEEINLITLF